VNERVEMSDWLEPVGEVFYGSCWSEVSVMMTYAELPGIYIHTDTGFVCTLDHVETKVIVNDEKRLVIRITNPTRFKANIKIFAEKPCDMNRILGQNSMLECPRVVVEPGSSKDLEFRKQCADQEPSKQVSKCSGFWKL